MRKLMIGAACVAFGVMGVASVAGANQPITQACFGDSVSTQAGMPGPYGQGVRTYAPRNGAGTLGDAIALVKQGLVDDGIFPNTCND